MLKDNPFHYSIATRIRNSYFLKYLNPSPQDKILEVGCGIGYFCKLLFDRGAEVWGIDLSSESVDVCKTTIGENFSVGNAELLEFSDQMFDKVLCTEVLEHVQDDKIALQEMFRVLKPNGSMLITIPTQDGVFGSKIKNIMHVHGEGPGKHEREGYTKKEIITLVESVGFKVIKTRYTMVFFTEIFMGITKLAYSKKTNEDHLDSQSDVSQISDSIIFKIFKLIFPLVLIVSMIDDILLHRLLKGHMIVLKAKK